MDGEGNRESLVELPSTIRFNRSDSVIMVPRLSHIPAAAHGTLQSTADSRQNIISLHIVI